MRYNNQARYPGPSSAVVKMFCDAEFHKRKLTELGVERSLVLSSSMTAGVFSIRIERKVPINFPGMKSLDATVTHEERWNATNNTGFVEVDTRGLPLRICCDAKLADDLAGCTVSYSWSIDATVPLIGGKIEKAVAADIAARFDHEVAAGLRHLDEYR